LLVGYALIALAAGWPMILVIIAGTIATVNGCRLDEGSVNPCVVFGRDMGETLYAMGVMGWFMIVTIPLGGTVFMGWTLIWLFLYYLRQRRAKSAAGTP
jgi:hypothetical protein